MRWFIGSLLSIALLVLVGAGLMTSVSAQQTRRIALPSTHFGSDQSTSPHGFMAAPGFAHAPVANNPDSPGARQVGEAVCASCHTKESENYAHTVHALGMGAALAADPGTATCESCHGGGSRHIESPTTPGSIISFTKDGGSSTDTQAASCLGCHAGGQRDQWTGSVHQRNDVSCSDCHNPMAKLSSEGLLAKQSISETCAGCHRDVRQQFNRRSHMPLPEGQMSCADCHNPHGTLNASLLKTDTVNETCYQCHAEKRGPMLFEHAPVRESCLNCHSPHGSNQQSLLVAPTPFLCQQCHSHVRHPNDLFTKTSQPGGGAADERLMARGCISCHSQIHGSNHPSGPRLHK